MIASLSLKKFSSSTISARASLHVRPPSAERLTVIALREPARNVVPVTDSADCHAVPSGPNVTHGSLARSKSPPLPAVPPEQRVNGTLRRSHVRPPSNDAPVIRPRAAPFDQRSCCHTPIRFRGSRGLIARCGSTSAPT